MRVFFAAEEGVSPFLEGTCLDERDDRCLVQPCSGGQSLWLPKETVFKRSPPAGALARTEDSPPAHSRYLDCTLW